MLYLAVKTYTTSMARMAAEINAGNVPLILADVTPFSIKERVRVRIENNHEEVWLIINTQTTARWDGKNEKVLFT